MRVDLRPMERADLALLAAWLREPLVAEWWHEDPDAVERRYGPSLDGTDPAVLRIGTLGEEPVGFVQWYRLADEPDYRAELAPHLAVPADAVSLDYLVGRSEHRGRGVGTALVAAALDEIGPLPAIVPVHTRNAASAGVLLANGFRVAAHADLAPDNPAHSREHRILVREPAAGG